MTETLSITYLKCTFCTAKNRCETCSEALAEALAQKRGIQRARVNVPDKSVCLDHDLDEDTLEDTLDAMGLLLG